jgi:hypothetical protein
MGRIECGRVQGTTHTLLGLAGHDIPRVVAVDKVVVVERLAGWLAGVGVEMPLRMVHGGNATNVLYGQHGLSERAWPSDVVLCHLASTNEKETLALPSEAARLQRQFDIRELDTDCTAPSINSPTTLAGAGCRID